MIAIETAQEGYVIDLAVVVAIGPEYSFHVFSHIFDFYAVQTERLDTVWGEPVEMTFLPEPTSPLGLACGATAALILQQRRSRVRPHPLAGARRRA